MVHYPCYTCRNYSGDRTCKFNGLTVKIYPEAGCSVWKESKHIQAVKHAIDILILSIAKLGNDYERISAVVSACIRDEFDIYNIHNYEVLESLCSILRNAAWECKTVLRDQSKNYLNDIMDI